MHHIFGFFLYPIDSSRFCWLHPVWHASCSAKTQIELYVNQAPEIYIQFVTANYFGKEKMKLNDCNCGGIPEVTFGINDENEFVICCSACEKKTPTCDSIREAANLWNETCGC